MDHNIRIDTGEKRITINDDPSRVLVFNPSDILFAEKFYALVGDFELRLREYQDKAAEIEAVTEADEMGLPVNLNARIELMKETCSYIRERIDHLFGDGTSNMAFGDTLNLDIFNQFFEGLTPIFKSVRQQHIERHINPPPNPPAKRKRSSKAK